MYGMKNQWYKHRYTSTGRRHRQQQRKAQTWSVSAVILQIKMLRVTGVKSDILNKPLSCQTWRECNPDWSSFSKILSSSKVDAQSVFTLICISFFPYKLVLPNQYFMFKLSFLILSNHLIKSEILKLLSFVLFFSLLIYLFLIIQCVT